MTDSLEAEKIIRSHVLWAMGGGLIPIPLVDFAAVTAIQLDMLQQLARLYRVSNYSESSGKAFVSALTGTTVARVGASLLKGIPGVGSLIGASMSVMSGASTYALGKVAVNLFLTTGGFTNFDLDPEEVKKAYEQAYEQGKSYVSNLENQEEQATNVYQALEKLGKLKEQGILSEEEFQSKKKELLERI